MATVAGLAGCGGLARIDRDIDQLTLDRSALLGGNAAQPDRRYRTGPVGEVERQEQLDYTPATSNPPADDLVYVPADAARLEAAAVERRLSGYFENALGRPVMTGEPDEAASDGEEPRPDAQDTQDTQPDRDAQEAREDATDGQIDNEGVAPDPLDGPARPPAGVRVLDLPGALRQAQVTGRDFLDAQEDYILAAISLLRERHLWGPRFFNDTTVDVTGQGDDGQIDNTLRLMNELRLTQRLPNGGDVAARWIVDATEQLRERATDDYRQSSSLVFDADIPLLRGAGAVARESRIQAERDLIYAARSFERFRRSFLVDIASDYFGLLEQAASISNQEEQLRNLRQTLERQRARLQAGEIALFEVSITESSVLQSSNALQSAYERYVVALDRFKIRLGIDPAQPLALRPLAFELQDPVATPADAAEAALLYRLDLQTLRDRVLDARRDVANARNDLLPDLDFNASVTLPTDPEDEEGGVAFDPDDVRYQAGLRFSLPLDRRIERLTLRDTQIRLERSLRGFEETRDTIVVDARSRLRSIEVARFQFILAEQQVRINELRFEEQQIKEDEVTPQELVDTLNELLNARNARDAALTDLRVAILEYLRDTGQLRVDRTGTLLPLRGMDLEIQPVDQPQQPGG